MKLDSVVRINDIYKIENFKIFCEFSNGEYRVIDFTELFGKWNVIDGDAEYPLLNISEFQKVKLENGTLSWDNVTVKLLDTNGEEKEYPYDIDPIVLYQNSKLEQSKVLENLGILA